MTNYRVTLEKYENHTLNILFVHLLCVVIHTPLLLYFISFSIVFLFFSMQSPTRYSTSNYGHVLLTPVGISSINHSTTVSLVCVCSYIWILNKFRGYWGSRVSCCSHRPSVLGRSKWMLIIKIWNDRLVITVHQTVHIYLVDNRYLSNDHFLTDLIVRNY